MTLLKQKPEEFVSPQQKPLVVAGIPAYNEEGTIAKIVLEAQKHADVVLVCDDGSTDSTADIAEKMGADVTKHEKNMGYGAAIKTLFEMARELNADVLVTIDGDGQHDPSEIPRLVKPVLENKVDVVLGSRFLHSKANGVPRYRSWGIRLITRLTGAVSRHRFEDAQCGFRVYGRKAIAELDLVENGMGSSVEVLMKAKRQKLTVAEVPAKCEYKKLEKTSTHNAFRHGTGVLMSIMRLVVEESPLVFLGLPGLLSLLTGTGFGIWMLQNYVVTRQIITNVALAAIAFILIGMFSIFTAITLYAISRQAQKNGNNHNHGGN
ncbi:MAG: glycosyltransferase family 2 protein [Candidatus Bathyarchaeota archaeon]|nr:MAG: glycosyltransferase family 2 protein [Candidatus Bathyarchaeota archaeon]